MGHMCYANALEAQAQKIMTHSIYADSSKMSPYIWVSCIPTWPLNNIFTFEFAVSFALL